MSGNVSRWRWFGRRARAAELVAADLLTDTQIGAKCGVTERTIERWKLVPEFAARVEERRLALVAAVQDLGIADRRNRVAAQDERWRRMRALMDARAGDLPEHVAGGETGLLVRQVKAVGYGPLQRFVDEYALDAALLAELRKLEEHTAKELGQWTEKHEVSESVVIRSYGGFDPDSV